MYKCVYIDMPCWTRVHSQRPGTYISGAYTARQPPATGTDDRQTVCADRCITKSRQGHKRPGGRYTQVVPRNMASDPVACNVVLTELSINMQHIASNRGSHAKYE
jgi:hypothetical protein